MTTKQLRRSGTVWDAEVSQFDLLLAAIPLALLAGIVSAMVFSVPPFVGITLGGALGGTLVGYGIYAVVRFQSTPTNPELSIQNGPRRLE